MNGFRTHSLMNKCVPGLTDLNFLYKSLMNTTKSLIQGTSLEEHKDLEERVWKVQVLQIKSLLKRFGRCTILARTKNQGFHSEERQ